MSKIIDQSFIIEHIRGIRCGDVLMFAGVEQHFLDLLENLYKKQVTYANFAPHTFGIFLTVKEVKQPIWGSIKIPYYLIWKPFFGHRWMLCNSVAQRYTRLKNPIGAILTLDLRLGELEVKQDHFNKWRGDELTEKLKAHVLRKDITETFQARMKELSLDVREGKYKPDGNIDIEPEMI